MRDVDGDGRDDYVGYGGNTWQIDYAYNGLNATPSAEVTYTMAGENPVVGDFDGDLKADLTTYDRVGTWRIDYSRNGFGNGINGDAIYGMPGARYQDTAQAADFDGDGKADLCTLGPNNGAAAYFRIDYSGNGLGSWDVELPGYGYPGSGLVAYWMAPGDFDGDGKADISVANTNGQWRIDYASNGFGFWDVQFLGGYIGGRTFPVAADFDLDGKEDLALKTDDGRWSFDFSSNGFGYLDAMYTYPHIGPGTPVFSDPADFDGDGKADFYFNFYSHFTVGCGFYCNQLKTDFAWNGLGGYEASVNNYGPFLSRLGDNPRYARRYFVRQQYLDHFGREPDQGGWDNWFNYLNSCGVDAACNLSHRITVARGFLESPEFKSNKPALNNPGTLAEYNQEYVRQCYLVFLRREPDSGGYNAWLNYINQTGDYNTLVHGFIYSGEYVARDQGQRLP
jgi:hypothetical protein